MFEIIRVDRSFSCGILFQVILKVDTVTLTVFMSTGTVMIQGNLVIDWFLNHFPSIMAHYDAPVCGPQPKTDVHRQYIQKWEGLEADYSIKKGFIILYINFHIIALGHFCLSNKTCHRDRIAHLTAPCPSHKKL